MRDDLPDCGGLYPPRVTAAAPPARSGEPQHRDDEFTEQMEELARLLEPKLEAQVAPHERAIRPAGVEWSPEVVARLLTVAADRARGDR